MKQEIFTRVFAQQLTDLDQLDIEIEPGVRVRDLTSSDQCAAVVRKIERDRDSICAQIAIAEDAPGLKPPGWRTRAQSALRWKKRVIKAVKARQETLPTEQAANSEAVRKERRRLILAVIEEDIGDEAMARYVRLARHRYPESFAPVDNGESGEKP
jgi:hypothetical protein